MNANCVFPKVDSDNDLRSRIASDLTQLPASFYVSQCKKLASDEMTSHIRSLALPAPIEPTNVFSLAAKPACPGAALLRNWARQF
jgi:hypothetical protein